MKSRLFTKSAPDTLLQSVCDAIHALAGGEAMRWVDARRVGDRLGLELADLEAALHLGLRQRYLFAEGEPVSRIALRDAGLRAVSILRKRRTTMARR